MEPLNDIEYKQPATINESTIKTHTQIIFSFPLLSWFIKCNDFFSLSLRSYNMDLHKKCPRQKLLWLTANRTTNSKVNIKCQPTDSLNGMKNNFLIRCIYYVHQVRAVVRFPFLFEFFFSKLFFSFIFRSQTHLLNHRSNRHFTCDQTVGDSFYC